VTVIVNGLAATPTRRALIKAVTEPGRIYYEPDAKAAYDRASGRKVSAVLKELVRAQWIRAARPDERQRGESQYLIYYRLDEFGPAALNGEAR
jgi:hypothetical protein